KIPNVQIYNSSTDSLTLQLNNTNIEIPASSTVYKYMENGTHEVICNDVKFTFDLAEKERVLINPFQDSVIMEEVLYVWTLTTFSVGHDVKNEDYTTPLVMLGLRGDTYMGPYKLMVGQRVIKGWDF